MITERGSIAMSQDNNENNGLQEVSRTVVITPEDVAGAAEFWPQFEVPLSSELKAAFERFIAEPTFENQKELKLQLTKEVSTSGHEAFLDEMFKDIREECSNVQYDMAFDKSLESQLTTEDDKN